MVYLPHAFYDDVLGQLENEDVGPVQELTGAIGRVAGDHRSKRRELRLWVASSIKTKLCGIRLTRIEREVPTTTPVQFSNLNSKYDRTDQERSHQWKLLITEKNAKSL
ncbi:hypothetical protein QR680_016448 [Steinernema hermaphroditum]|nr:hypothetical protein QR680_016448 [Steinernema hermaphroditum]